jgi:hypothetical protein
MLHRLASSLSTLYKSMKKSPENGAKLSNTYVKAKTTMFFSFATEITNFLRNCRCNSSSLLHRFSALIFFFCKALRQRWQIREAMKWWNVNYDKKLKQWSNEAFNTSSVLLPSFDHIWKQKGKHKHTAATVPQRDSMHRVVGKVTFTPLHN